MVFKKRAAPKRRAAKKSVKRRSAKRKGGKKKRSGKKKSLTKAEVLQAVTDCSGVEKKHVRNVLAGLMEVGHREMAKRGMFMLAGFAKFVVKKKKATKRRRGINPFTQEPCWFKPKPASKAVRARPVKLIKEAVNSKKRRR